MARAGAMSNFDIPTWQFYKFYLHTLKKLSIFSRYIIFFQLQQISLQIRYPHLNCPLYFRVQAVFAHVQTFFNLPSLDVPIEINNIDTEHLSEGYEARASYLKYDIFFIYGLFYKLRFSFFPLPLLRNVNYERSNRHMFLFLN